MKLKYVGYLIIVMLGIFLIYREKNYQPTTLGVATKTSECQVAEMLPDKDCTPGAVFENVTKEQICVSGYSASVRDVSASLKKQIYEKYGIYSHTTGEYEVDHLISLQLGGSNDESNLWPEIANPTAGYKQKDKLENYLHKLVCDGEMDLKDAQKRIANDWYISYQDFNLQ